MAETPTASTKVGREVAGRLSFEFDGCLYNLEFDFAAIAWFERAADVSLVDVAQALEIAALGGPQVKLSHMVWLLQAGLQKHHAGIDFETVGKMFADRGVKQALDLAFAGAMPDAEEEPGGNAPGAAPNGAGTGSSATR